jgi:SpoVK/Ycf46/Vps4 family AAA+-type ATPase
VTEFDVIQLSRAVFIDELDALATSRSQDIDASSRRVLTELLLEMNELRKMTERVVVIAATNRIEDLDPAILRRFERTVFMELPDALNIEKIMKKKLWAVNHQLKEEDFTAIASRMVELRYSPAIVEQACKEAVMNALRNSIESFRIDKKSEKRVVLRPVAISDFTLPTD